MGIAAVLDGGNVLVVLSGLDRFVYWRRSVTLPIADIESVGVEERQVLESFIDHRAFGQGMHNGAKRPGRRRVGTMLGRGVRGKQFWAVSAGPMAADLIVLSLRDHEFVRAVLEVSDTHQFSTALQGRLRAKA